jgi:SAM-dependent methyltransferase
VLKELMKHTGRPALFTRGNCNFWDDPHTSQLLLEAHLNPDWDAASRRPATIEQTVAWVAAEFLPETDATVLDLGSGPGLYSQRFARMGHNVTGMDFSRRSIAYARERAAEEQLAIKYIYQNYLELDYEEAFDLVVLIYCDVGALTDSERDSLFTAVYRALKPGGTFVFDVLSDECLVAVEEKRDWELLEDGFWAGEPHLALTEAFVYQEERVSLSQTLVARAECRVDVHRIYTHYYNESDLRELLLRHGFTAVKTYDGLIEEDNFVGNRILFASGRK